MTKLIHPTAIIEKGAEIASDVAIGAYSIIGSKVKLHKGVEIQSHVCIKGNTEIGENTQVYPFAILGFPPPDLKYKGEDSKLIIGKNNIIREHVTIHIGTAVDRNQTVIGDNCLFMAGSHVAHDCIIGNNVIMANCAALGGHVVLGDFVIIGGLAAVQQKVRIGAHAIIGGMTGVDTDVVPYARAVGDRARLAGVNIIGLKRQNISNVEIIKINEALDELFNNTTTESFENRLQEIEQKFIDSPYVQKITEFLKEDLSRSICTPRG